MALIDLFFTQSVTIMPLIQYAQGEPVYGKAEKRKCRLERGRLLNRGYFNERGALDVAPAGTKMFCTGKPIPTGSLVFYGESEYVVKNCRIMNGFADHHLEVSME